MDKRKPLAEQVRFCEERWFRETREQAIAGDLSSMLLVAQMLTEGYGCAQSLKNRLQEALYFLRLYLLQRFGTASLAQLETLVSSSGTAEEALRHVLGLYREARTQLAELRTDASSVRGGKPARLRASSKPLQP
jgi:hypothetical protein